MKNTTAKQVENFYNAINFPGTYDIESLLDYGTPIENKYLEYIEKHIQFSNTVLDAGCGTGLTTNLFAIRNPNMQFTGIDFSNSIVYAKSFAHQNKIKNVKFYQKDLLKYKKGKFDCIVCQGVLHHIPDVEQAVQNLSSMLDKGGKIILGLYHPMGKTLKKFAKLNYRSDILYKDQELHPYETTWTKQDVVNTFQNYSCIDQYPKKFIGLHSIINSKSGGLCMYTLEKTK